jgi:hypothetical protein
MRRGRVAGVVGLIALLGLALALGGPSPAVLAVAARDPATWADQAGTDMVATTAATLACWLVWLWLTVGLLLTAATAVPGSVGRLARAVARHTMPTSMRRLTTVVLGVSLGTSIAGCTQPTAAGAHPSNLPAITSSPLRGPLPPAATSVPAGGRADRGRSPRPPASSGAGTPDGGRADSGRSPAHTGSTAGSLTPGLPPATTVLDADRDGRGADPSPPATARIGVDWPLGTGPQRNPTVPPVHRVRPETGVDWPLGPAPDPPRPAGRARTRNGAGASAAAPGHRGGAAVGRSRDPARATDVVVAPGDCLWLIAARHLDTGATAGQIGTEAQRWYATNKAIIGPDPDLIRPGQTLATPP